MKTSEDTERGWEQLGAPHEGDRTERYARWFIRLRWGAVLTATVLVFVSVRVSGLLTLSLWWPLLATVATLAAFNLLCLFLVQVKAWPQRQLAFQVYGDLVILTVLLHFSGGVENPLSLLFVLHVILGGILLSRLDCYAVAAVASALLCGLAVAESSGLVAHYTLRGQASVPWPPLEDTANNSLYLLTTVGVQSAMLLLVAYFVTTLAERARSYERRLKVMAERARAEHRLLDQALETTETGLRVLDSELRPHWVNRHWAEWFAEAEPVTTPAGHSPNRDTSDARTDAAAVYDNKLAARNARNDGRTRVTEHVLAHTQGPPSYPAGPGLHGRIIRVTTAPLTKDSGDTEGVVELAQDISRQKDAEAQMLWAGQMAAVGELAGRVAHEVNNPIAIISAKMRLLLSDHSHEMSEKCSDEIHKVVHLCDRVARVAQGLLSYCRRSDRGRAPIDIREPIRRVLTTLGQHADKAGVTLQDQLDDRLPAINANRDEVEQVFLNLFLNSLDAMPHGGSITVSNVTDDHILADGTPCITIVVSDTGVGVPEEIRDHIFEPFFTTKGEKQGTGLGLSICLAIIRSHGGELNVETESGSGTRFMIKLRTAAANTSETMTHG